MKLSNIHKCNQQSKTVTKTSSGMDGSLFIHCTTKLTGVLTRLWWNDAVLNSLKPLPTSTTQKPIPSNPFFRYHTETVRFFTLLLHSPNSLISDKCLKSLTPVTRGFNAAKAHSFYNSTCMCVKTWPKKKKKAPKKSNNTRNPYVALYPMKNYELTALYMVKGEQNFRLIFFSQYNGQCHCNYCI